MPIFPAVVSGLCVFVALIPASHPTPIIDAVLYGLAVVNALLVVVALRTT